jgi:osmotically-inducible protein OsmY
VVLTGTVETLTLKQRAVSLTHKISGVKEVTDEMRVGPGESFRDYSRDSWITTNLKTTLLFDSRISSRNYTIRSVNRAIYLMGIAQNQQELDWVLEHAKGISGVKRVVSHVRVKPVSVASHPPSSAVKETDEDVEESSAAG